MKFLLVSLVLLTASCSDNSMGPEPLGKVDSVGSTEAAHTSIQDSKSIYEGEGIFYRNSHVDSLVVYNVTHRGASFTWKNILDVGDDFGNSGIVPATVIWYLELRPLNGGNTLRYRIFDEWVWIIVDVLEPDTTYQWWIFIDSEHNGRDRRYEGWPFKTRNRI